MSGTVEAYQRSVNCLLDDWQALSMVVAHSFGGQYSLEKADWLKGVICEFLTSQQSGRRCVLKLEVLFYKHTPSHPLLKSDLQHFILLQGMLSHGVIYNVIMTRCVCVRYVRTGYHKEIGVQCNQAREQFLCHLFRLKITQTTLSI